MGNIILVRHGETKEGKAGIILGHLGGNLTQDGKDSAKKIAKIISKLDLRFQKIVTSDLKRAFNTARIISTELNNLPIEKDQTVRERSAGIAEGKKDSEINWNDYEKSPWVDRKHRDGESFGDVYQRAQNFLDKHRDQDDIILVSHTVFILMLIAAALKISPEKIVTEEKYDLSCYIVSLDLENKKVVPIRIPL